MTPEQESVLQYVKQRQNVFITSPAGFGKSYTIQRVVEWAKSMNINFGITAMTGAAAILIEGRTLHSFIGIGIAKEPAEALYLQSRKYIQKKLNKLHLLIIDEVSMLDSELFEKISLYLGLIRNRPNEPFGGIQLLFSGDMFQLPPVKGDYCFQSLLWNKCQFQVVQFTKNMRQQNDVPFQKLLESLRQGECSAEDLELLKSLSNTEFTNGIVPTRLYSLNIDVDRINQAELQQLVQDKNPPLKTYPTKYHSKVPQVKVIAKSMNVPESIQLCTDAQVVLTRNLDLDKGLVNGSRGVVVKVLDNSVLVQFQKGVLQPITYYDHQDEDLILFSYIPLRLAYALSIHKCQGMTLDAIEIDLGQSIFCHGQAYTALSRAKNMTSVKIIDVHPKSFRTHPQVLDFYTNNKN